MPQGWGPPEWGGAGSTTAFTEDGGAVAIVPAITIVEPDENLPTVSVAISSYHTGEDVLALPAMVGIGNITASFDATAGVLTLTSAGGTATSAEWQVALRAVTYDNTSEDPTEGSRTLTLTAVDAGGGGSVAVTQALTVAAVNDAPSGTSSAIASAFGVAHTLSVADFGFSDADGDGLLAVRMATLPATGALTLDGVAVTAGQRVSAADIADGLLVFTPQHAGSVSFTFQVQDDGGVAGSGVDLDPTPDSLTINVAAAPPPEPPQPTVGTDGDDFIMLRPETLTYAGGGGADRIYGGEGDNVLQGNAGADYILGGGGADIVRGGRDDDQLDGESGDDQLFGDLGDDRVTGGEGADVIDGGDGHDTLQGNSGADTVVGGAGADWLMGGRDADRLDGGAGADWMSGDLGNDTLTGGAGADVFNFAGGGVDRVTDFHAAEGDRVQLVKGAAYELVQVGTDTVIDLGRGDQVILQNVQLSALPTGWIIA